MEDVLAVYTRPRDGDCPLVCLDEFEGRRHVKVKDRHTAVDYAHVLKSLVDIHFAHAKTIVLVQDNLSIYRRLHSTKLFRPSKPGA